MLPAPMPSPFRRMLASPALHFLIAGAALFGAMRLFDAGAEDPATIRVERDALLAFVQARTRTASLDETAQAFDAAAPAVRQDWIDRFVREEALVREARALGLDREDELIRRRLVQQMEFLVESGSAAALAVPEEELAAAVRDRAEAFREPATVRFAHVFVRVEAGRREEVEARARGLLERLQREEIGVEGALALGDRFLYERVYVDRTLDEVRSHFGDALAQTLAALPVDPVAWRGPIASEHGLHLVLLTARSESRLPERAALEGALREELMREKREAVLERGVEKVVARYGVELGTGLGPDAAETGATADGP